MTVAALSPGAARMPALPMAPGDHADVMARLAEKAKEDVLVALLGALRGVATAVTVTAQRLQALQEEAAIAAACSQGLSRPSGGNQAETFCLDDEEDSPLVQSACIHDLEAEYDRLDSAAASSPFGSTPARQVLPSRELDMAQVQDLISAFGASAAPPADHAPLLAQVAAMAATSATATASTAASSSASASFPGLAFDVPDLPVSRSRLDDEAACGRCGTSGDAGLAPPRTAGRVCTGDADYGYREIGNHDEDCMQKLMAKAAACPRCPAESSASGGDAAHARCGPSWLVPVAHGMSVAEEGLRSEMRPSEQQLQETEAHGVACSGRLPCAAKVDAEVADDAKEPEDSGGAGPAAASPVAPPGEGEGRRKEEEEEEEEGEEGDDDEEGKTKDWSDEEWRLWIEAAALAAQPPAASSEPLAAAGRPPAVAGAACDEEAEAVARGAEGAAVEAAMDDHSVFFKVQKEQEGSTLDAGQVEVEAATDDSTTFKEQGEDSLDATRFDAEACAYFRQLSGESSADVLDEDPEALAAEAEEAEAEAEASEDPAAVEVPEVSAATAQVPADAKYYVLCFAKNWQRESPMRPVKAEAACEYANVGGTWLAHPLDFRFNTRTTKFQISGDWTKCRAIWSGAVRDEAEMDPSEVSPSRGTWPTLELGGPALPATLRTNSQQALKGLDWMVGRLSGGSAVAILYNPEKGLILCRPAEDVEELREEVARAHQEREKGNYLVRGSEGWEIPDGQGPMSLEVDANGDHQLVQVITLPPGASSEQLRVLKDGQAEQRFAPLATDVPESHVLQPNGPGRPGSWITAEQRTWPPVRDWVVCAEEGATVQIVWQVQAQRLLCRPCEEPKPAQSPGEAPKQVRAGRWTTLAARGAGAVAASAGDLAAPAAVAAPGAADRPEGAEGEEARSQSGSEVCEKDLEEAFLAAEGPRRSEQQSYAADESEKMLESSWAEASGPTALPTIQGAVEWGAKEPVAKLQQLEEPELISEAGAKGQEEVPEIGQAAPFESREEAATADSVDWAAEASVEELVQRMDLDDLSSKGSEVSLELEMNAYTAAIALARVCEASLEVREHALAAGAAKALARLFSRDDRPSSDAGDPEAKLMVSTARESASFAWETLPVQASEGRAQADAAAREVARATTWDLQGHFEVLEQECLGVLGARHAAQEPRRRRGSSWARTLSFAKVKLGAHYLPIRDGSVEKPFRIWVFGATNEVEVALAEEGFFQDANIADSAPTEVVLVGDCLRDLELTPGREDGAVVRTMSCEELRWRLCLGAPLPDLAAAMMPGAEGQGLPPDQLLEAIEEVPAVVSMRFQLDESTLLALKQKMGRGRLLWKPTPCPFSSCPEGSAAAFADNGWIMAVQGPGTLKRVWTVGAPHVAPPGEPRPKAELIPACFWGILDIKYDTSRPVLERVKVLETGDGKTSKFSGDGSDLKRRYQEKYKPGEDSSIAMYEVISADKLLTHNLTADNGYEHVLPKQGCFERRYKPDLAEHIASELGLTSDKDLVILKLCNRTRGAGVVVVPRGELDEKLRCLLQPPQNLEAWFSKHRKNAFKTGHLDLGIKQHASFQEQERHWWSNECPVFVAESCEYSLLTKKNGGNYDGTLRAGFVLRRRGAQKVSGREKARKAMVKARQTGEALPEMFEEDEEQASSGTLAEDFEIDWLGCYWKLPKKPRKSSSESSREAIVSAARTSGTAQVHAAHCQEVYAALGDLVPRLFCTPEFQPEKLAERYGPYPGLPAYLTATLSASMKRMKQRRARMRAEDLLKQAKQMLSQEEDSRGVALANSFVHREFCSCLARQQSAQNWSLSVGQHNKESLRYMPTNATSLYIRGMTKMQSNLEREAEEPLLHSLLLDPDFKLAYVQLGICFLRQRKWEQAIAVCEAGMERNPQQPQFKYHLGLAYYKKSMSRFEPGNVEDLRERALEYLRAARQSPEARKVAKGAPPFSPQDDHILRVLECTAELPHVMEDVTLSPKVGWVCASVRI